MKKIASIILTAVMLATMLSGFAVPAIAEDVKEGTDIIKFTESETATSENGDFELTASAFTVFGWVGGDDTALTIRAKYDGMIITRIEAVVSNHGADYGGVGVSGSAVKDPNCGVSDGETVCVNNINASEFSFAGGASFSQFTDITVYYTGHFHSFDDEGKCSCGKVLCEEEDTPGMTWELTEGNTKLTIGGEGAMPDFQTTLSDDRPWANAVDTITAVRIQPGVKSIGKNAFKNCKNLISVSIPSSVQSIGEYAFCACQSLKSVTIPFGVTSIGNSAFYNCTSLESITIPFGVTSIGDSAFKNCTSLESVTIPESVTSIGGLAFYSCSKLASVTIPSGVTSIGGLAFYGCSKLASVTIPSSVQSIGTNAFSVCTSLTSITIPSGVKSIDNGAFAKCTGLESISFPSSIQTAGNAVIADCSNLTSVTLKAKTPPTWPELPAMIIKGAKFGLYIPDGTSNDYNTGVWGMIFSPKKVKEAYVVDDQPGGNGTITFDKDCFPTETYTEPNETVTVTVTPAAGYRLKADSLSVVAENGTAIALTQDETDPMKYTFTMPCSNVTVTAEFEACEHSESEWVVEAEATCVIDGYRVNKCKACGKVLEAEVIPATGEHTFDTSKWCGNSTHHWYAATCGHEEVLNYQKHIYAFGSNTCKICKYNRKTNTFPSSTGSALSEGNIWIIAIIAVAAIGGTAVLVIVKKKKKTEESNS